MGKLLKAYSDLDLDPTMPNIKPVRGNFICYNVFKFHIPRAISFRVIMQKHTDAHTHTPTYTQNMMSTL